MGQIKTKKDAKDLLDNMTNEEGLTFSTGGSYWKERYGNNISFIRDFNCEKIMYNFKNGNSSLLNDIEISEQEAINLIYENRKYYNFFIREEEKEFLKYGF